MNIDNKAIDEYNRMSLNKMSPSELGLYASNKLSTGFAAFAPVDATLIVGGAFANVKDDELKEMIRYSNHLAEKECLGKDFYKVDKNAKIPDYSRKPIKEDKPKYTTQAAAAA